MTKIALLFSLIKSLSKSEKRYFKLLTQMQEGEKGFVILYELLDNSPNYDENLANTLKTTFPEKTIEPARKYLYQLLMKSLRLFEQNNTVENKLMNLIQDCQILFNKGHLQLYKSQLEKAKALAINYEKYSYYLILGRMELQNLTRLQFSELDEMQLIQKQDQFKRILQHESLIHEHSSLYEILLYRYLKNGIVRNNEEMNSLNDLLLEETYILQKTSVPTFESKKLHLHFQSAYFLMTGSHQGSLGVFYELNELFEKNTNLWADAPIYYIYLLEGILTDLRNMGRFEEMTFFINQLENVSLQYKNITVLGRYLAFCYKINQFIDKREEVGGLTFYHNNEQEFEKNTLQLPINLQVQYHFTLARLYYFNKLYPLALKHSNIILSQFPEHLSSSFYSQCHMLNLLIHHSLGNFDYLNYALQSLERKLKIEKKFYAIEQLVIQVFRNILKEKKKSKKLLQQFQEISDNPYNQQILQVLALEKWIHEQLKE